MQAGHAVSLYRQPVRSLILVDPQETMTFATAGRTAADLALSPHVARHWTQESACAGMSVGGLAYHLGTQTDLAVRVLRDERTHGHADAGALVGPALLDLGSQGELGGDPGRRGERRGLVRFHEDQATDRVRL